MIQQSHSWAFIPEKPMYTIHMHTQGEATLTLAVHLSYLEAINHSNWTESEWLPSRMAQW